MIRLAYFAALLTTGLLVAISAPAPASAQNPGSDAASGSGGQGRRHKQDQAAGGSSPPAHHAAITIRPEPWPRLDPGAVFCRSADDLQQRSVLIRAQLDGGPPAPTSTSACPLIRTPTPIEVVERRGPGQTQVRVKADGTLGWTDAYLPDKSPH
jgi:hypothetical protein